MTPSRRIIYGSSNKAHSAKKLSICRQQQPKGHHIPLPKIEQVDLSAILSSLESKIHAKQAAGDLLDPEKIRQNKRQTSHATDASFVDADDVEDFQGDNCNDSCNNEDENDEWVDADEGEHAENGMGHFPYAPSSIPFTWQTHRERQRNRFFGWKLGRFYHFKGLLNIRGQIWKDRNVRI
ncbi:hypothetical protein BCR33DRAFT_745939 [Rhizoclosmatium globosum]|uniref:Uncharacterized protein n=1 Tax=Rhizoclosmatium globosum TaxID=329046 RepID=A0A1Y2AZ32_9FUNG|nr:hypothetical protein BCR33DRAFT_745939 [Rhizoclosmatium globosum]|eukprot:ORY27724.1 hypothetical protein BCR33DRAFT_745939 [Rhizoclosmatium globosum]